MSNTVFDIAAKHNSYHRYNRARDFLRDIMVEEIKEKLNDHQRTFSKNALIAFEPEDWAKEIGIEADLVPFAEHLGLDEGCYDSLLHIGVMGQAEDVVGQMIQARLALKPDGVFFAAFLGGETLKELRAAFMQAEIEVYNGASPHIAPMIDLRDAGGLLARAGFALPVADHIRQKALYGNTKSLMHDLRDMGLNNPLQERRKRFTRPSLFQALEKHYPVNHDDKITASYELIFLTGYAPSENQPKPLQPGSAQIPLGEALEKLKDK